MLLSYHFFFSKSSLM